MQKAAATLQEFPREVAGQKKPNQKDSALKNRYIY